MPAFELRYLDRCLARYVAGACALTGWQIAVPLLVAVLGGGLIVELIKLGLTPWTMRHQQKVAERMKLVESLSAAEARRELAHVEAAATHTEAVAKIYELLDAIVWPALADDHGMHNPEGNDSKSPYLDAGKAMALLRQIWTSHPTKDVRVIARKLFDELADFYGSHPGHAGTWPNTSHREEILKHLQIAEDLIEAIHTPPPSHIHNPTRP